MRSRSIAGAVAKAMAVSPLLLLLAGVACCSSDDSELGRALSGEGEESAPSGDVEPQVAAIDWEECEAARLLLYDRVAADDEITPEPTVRSAWAEMVATVPVELTDQAAFLADVVNRDFDDPASVTTRDVNLFISGLDRITDWALDACPPTEPVWGCRERSTLHPAESEAEADGHGSPEEVAVRDGERVEIERSTDEVVFAWLDDDGYAGRQMTVARDGGEWSAVEEIACDDLDARRSGGPLDPTQASSSSSSSTTVVGE